MVSRKLFTNQTPHPLIVTLVIRASDDPRNTAGTKQFHLDPNESKWQEYGDPVNIYLNGINVEAMQDGGTKAHQQIIVHRGSALDDQLNRYNAVTILSSNGGFLIDTRQVYPG